MCSDEGQHDQLRAHRTSCRPRTSSPSRGNREVQGKVSKSEKRGSSLGWPWHPTGARRHTLWVAGHPLWKELMQQRETLGFGVSMWPFQGWQALRPCAAPGCPAGQLWAVPTGAWAAFLGLGLGGGISFRKDRPGALGRRQKRHDEELR